MPRGRPKKTEETVIMELGRIKISHIDSYNFSVSGDDKVTYHADRESAVKAAVNRATGKWTQPLNDWLAEYRRLTVNLCKALQNQKDTTSKVKL